MKTDFTDEFKAADLIEKDVRIISRDSEGIATKTVTVIQATTSKWTFAHKVITIDDETGIVSERFLVNDPDGYRISSDTCDIAETKFIPDI